MAEDNSRWRQTYLVWSNEHQAWWAPYECGYISIISQAGRYDRSRAERICSSANEYLCNGAEPNEVMVLAPECIEPVLPSHSSDSEAAAGNPRAIAPQQRTMT